MICPLVGPLTLFIAVRVTDYYYYYYYETFFNASFNWWFFARVWVTASLKSPGLYNLYPSSNFQFHLYHSFIENIKSIDYNWYHRHFHVPQFFQFPDKVLVLIFSLSFNFTLRLARTEKSITQQVLFFFVDFLKFGRLPEIGWSVCILKSKKGLCVSFSGTDSENYYYYYYYYYY